MRNSSQNIILQSNVNNTITFTGRRYDSESGLYYYRNRMYSPNLGRFISKDPKGYVDGMNLYAYVKNNPLKYLDAFGTTAVKSNSYLSDFTQSISNAWDSVSNSVSDSYNEVKDTVINYGSDALTSVGGGMQVLAGGTMILGGSVLDPTPGSLALGTILVAHGSNNFYEGVNNIKNRFNGVEKQTIGLVREGYRELSKLITGKEDYGDMAYYGIDLGTSISGALRTTGIKTIKSGVVEKTEKTYGYQDFTKSTAIIEGFNDISSVNKIVESNNK